MLARYSYLSSCAIALNAPVWFGQGSMTCKLLAAAAAMLQRKTPFSTSVRLLYSLQTCVNKHQTSTTQNIKLFHGIEGRTGGDDLEPSVTPTEPRATPIRPQHGVQLQPD